MTLYLVPCVMHLGGHTSEMIQLISKLSNMYEPRVYVMANTDNVSSKKVESLERKRSQGSERKMVSFFFLFFDICVVLLFLVESHHHNIKK